MKIQSHYDRKTKELIWICPKCKQIFTVPSELSLNREDLLDLAAEAQARCIRCGTKYTVCVPPEILEYQRDHSPITTSPLTKERMQEMLEYMKNLKREKD